MSDLIKKYHKNKGKYLHSLVMVLVETYRNHKFVDDDGNFVNCSKLTEESVDNEDPEAMEGLAKLLSSYVVLADKDDKSYKTVGDFIVDHICMTMYHCRYDGDRDLTYKRYKMVQRKGRMLLDKSIKHKDYFFKVYMVAAKTLGTALCLMEKGVFNEGE
jgi:hypothetical protein